VVYVVSVVAVLTYCMVIPFAIRMDSGPFCDDGAFDRSLQKNRQKKTEGIFDTFCFSL